MRANVPDALDDLALPFGREPKDESFEEGTFSLVVDTSEGKTRKLPTYYFGKAQMFASRDLQSVLRELESTVRIVLDAPTTPTYQLTACRVGSRIGLYARDWFARSPLRMKLRRQGLVFSEEPFVHLTERSTFVCSDLGEFRPDFLIIPGAPGTGLKVEVGARVIFSITSARLQATTAAELARISASLAETPSISSPDAEELVGWLRQENVAR